MSELNVRHRFNLGKDGNPIRKTFSRQLWDKLPAKTIDGQVYLKLGFVIETESNKATFTPPESLPLADLKVESLPLADLNIVKLKQYVKDKGLDVKVNQPKDDILEDLKAIGHE